jgi:hypothetical protein
VQGAHGRHEPDRPSVATPPARSFSHRAGRLDYVSLRI